MSDVITKIYPNEDIKNGSIRIQSPHGAGVSAVTGAGGANYEINTYSTTLPTTGTVFTKYTERFDDYQFYST